MIDLIIKGGLVVTSDGPGNWDILIKGEKIIGLVHPHTLQVDAVKIIDASGKIVVPGGIEPHAHIGGPRQPERSGAAPVSLAAIYGGTTTVLDFATQIPGYDIKHALDEANDRWDGNAFTDFSYHPIFTKGASAEHIDQIPELIQDGFPSFKIFTTSIRPPSPQMQDNKTDFGRLAVIMKKLSTHAGILLVHSEDDEMVHYNYSRAKSNDLWDWWNMHRIHTNISEEVSFNRVINLAERLKCSIYFVHVSAKEGIQVIDQARLRGLPIYGETLHNYACFNSNNYKEEHGMKYHTYPSLKSAQDSQSLWEGLIDGKLSTIATDLVSTTWEEKTRFKTVADVTGGHNGIETRMGVTYTETVVKRKASLKQFVDITSTNAAKLFGLYPRKGIIATGSDADITIIDPTIVKTLSMDDLHLEDYSIWEGWNIVGWPITTMLRGRIIICDGKLNDNVPHGQLIRRTISNEILERPLC